MKGWYGKSQQHSLASRGVFTNSVSIGDKIVRYAKKVSQIEKDLIEIFDDIINDKIVEIKPLVSAVHFNNRGFIVETKYSTYYVFDDMRDVEDYAEEFLMVDEEISREEAEFIVNCDPVEMSLTTFGGEFVGEFGGYWIYLV